MIIADLIRAEMPDGSQNDLGVFPSATLDLYLEAIGISDPFADLDADGDTEFPTSLPSVTPWATGWSIPTDSAAGDGLDEAAANKSEFLYQILANINVDGVPAVDQLGQAIGDTDGDGVLEIVDAWGEPLYLQWQQEQLHLPTIPSMAQVASEINNNVWVSEGNFVGLSREHADATMVGYSTANSFLYSKPVLPTQIRPLLISERLLRIDGLSTDYDPGHSF